MLILINRSRRGKNTSIRALRTRIEIIPNEDGDGNSVRTGYIIYINIMLLKESEDWSVEFPQIVKCEILQ
jgi:hypothetical protein